MCLSLLALPLLLATLATVPQDASADRPGAGTVLLIEVGEDVRAAFDTLAATLQRRGYALERTDTLLLSLRLASRSGRRRMRPLTAQWCASMRP